MAANDGRRLGPPAVVVLAGLDPTGGAGLAADLATLHALDCDPLPVATANTVQGPGGPGTVRALAEEEVRGALDAVTRMVAPAAVKVGMLGGAGPARALLAWLEELPAAVPLVIDPVLAASDGTPLVDAAGEALLAGPLLRRATLITPTGPEAARLLGAAVPTDADAAERCARELVDRGVGAALVTGGHLAGEPIDVLFDGVDALRIPRTRLPDARGTGCRLASACAAALARGDSVDDAVRLAGEHVARLLRGPRLPGGRLSG